MAVLLVNNIPFPVADGGLETSFREIGSVRTAFDGSLRRNRSALKRDLSVTSTLLPLSEALAWQVLLNGSGEFWSFDASLYGSKGTGPSGGIESAALVASARFGANSLDLPPGTSVTYAGVYQSSYTVMFWRRPYGSGTWTHWVLRSDGARWMNGAPTTSPAPVMFSASAGAVTLSGEGSLEVYADELVILPALVPDAWPPAAHGLSTLGRTFTALPRLSLAGTAVLEGGSRTVLATVEASSLVQASSPLLSVSVLFQET